MNNDKKEKRGGFWAPLMKMLGGSSSASIGASSGAGASGSFLSGLFATKAGIIGLILGGATLAAGIGVVYNFMGSSSSGNNYQDMFANSYYEDNATAAADSRAKYNSGGSDVSSLDMFSKQAKEEGVGLEGESSEATGKSDSSEAESSELASAPSAEVKADNAKGNSGKLNSSLGSSFNKMGASAGGTSGNSLKSMGGLSSGIGGSFASAKLKNSESTLTAMAQPVKAKTNAKKAALSKKSRSALAQAKYAAIKGKQALGSSTVTGGKSLASEAFVGETGSGDVAATEGAGMGLGGAGLSSGDSLKSNNPNLNTNESQIPDPGESEDASPWANLESLIQKLSMAAAAIYLIGTLLKKFASSNFIAMNAVKYLGMALMAIGAAIVVCSVIMMTKYGQKMGGIAYALAGAVATYMGYSLVKAGMDGAEKAKQADLNKTQAANQAKLGTSTEGTYTYDDGSKLTVSSDGTQTVSKGMEKGVVSTATTSSGTAAAEVPDAKLNYKAGSVFGFN